MLIQIVCTSVQQGKTCRPNLNMILGETIMTTNENNIAAAKNEFEAAFAEKNFYAKQTSE